MKRREILKYFSLAPLAGAVAGSAVPFNSVTATPAALVKRDLIKELGLRTFINAYGVYTTHTASLMTDEVLEAINATSKQYVLYNDLQDKVGEKIAAMCHAEAAMVTSGCWSALVLGTAGVLTGMDRKKVALLPDVSDFEKNEVILQKSHSGSYDHALSNTGIKRVFIETVEELEKAITSRTAMMWYYNEAAPWGKIGHNEWLAIAKKTQDSGYGRYRSRRASCRKPMEIQRNGIRPGLCLGRQGYSGSSKCRNTDGQKGSYCSGTIKCAPRRRKYRTRYEGK